MRVSDDVSSATEAKRRWDLVVPASIHFFPPAPLTVLTLYLGPTINLKLRPTILNMRPGTRVVSNSLDMPNWRPDRQVEAAIGNTRAFLWIVPARIGGLWRFSEVGRDRWFALELRQRFQYLETSPATPTHLAVQRGRLLGTQVEVVVEELDAKPMTLTGKSAATVSWSVPPPPTRYAATWADAWIRNCDES